MMEYASLAGLAQRIGVLMDDNPPLDVLRLRIKSAKWA